MKRLPVLLFIFFSLSVTAQDKVSAYFESIRNNEALLTAFLPACPRVEICIIIFRFGLARLPAGKSDP
jgi:hypothetical protein